jgi:hypothetical protein
MGRSADDKFCFPSSKNVLVSHLFLKNIFTGLELGLGLAFSLRIWKILWLPSGLHVSDEKSIVIQVILPLQLTWHFLPGPFNALFLAFRSLLLMWVSKNFFGFTLGSLSFLKLYRIFSHYVFKYFSIPYSFTCSGTAMAWIQMFCYCSSAP